jgi:transcriptional regulator with XRE-family HTH domain
MIKEGTGMEQIKIGKFIAACRKENNMTQAQLAEKLSITDRAVSKWENGKGMPDSSIMLNLCNELGITVNELLCGEKITMEEFNEKAEKKLIELKRKEELSNKVLIKIACLFGATMSLFYFGLGVADIVTRNILLIVSMVMLTATATLYFTKYRGKWSF